MRLSIPGAKTLVCLLFMAASAGLMAEYSKAVRVEVHVVGKKDVWHRFRSMGDPNPER